MPKPRAGRPTIRELALARMARERAAAAEGRLVEHITAETVTRFRDASTVAPDP